jgi:hypothetical protein
MLEQEPSAELPRTATQLAMLAVQLHQVFLAQAPLLDRLDEQAAKDDLRAAVLAASRDLIAASSG